ncbi:MAG: 4-(cytidine 5'-diphospho)-2-C-methyl-D-erythritol kinase [Verrucomicrobiae bacterium]|nr:4-(cytidine 5'-diphospho)-2-C-methyl-D-erythritol kinase [Verrucomicrobiae bacterium]
MALHILAPCKINLVLNILGRRPDGYHELETVMYPVPLFDELDLEPANNGVELSCSDPVLPRGASNLVVRAAEAFFEHSNVKGGVRIRLVKKIPVAAGLGGGSSDAAQTLVGLNELFGRPLGADVLSELAAKLGSDVPYFLNPGPALATGRGEHIEPLRRFHLFDELWVLLVYPGFGVPTRWAYKALQKFPSALNGAPGRARRFVEHVYAGNLSGAVDELYNALEAPVLTKYPLLQLYRDFLNSQGAIAAMMSGSGSTIFALTSNEREAHRIRQRLIEKFGSTLWSCVVPAGARRE